jgi:hypothetical protein
LVWLWSAGAKEWFKEEEAVAVQERCEVKRKGE